MELAPRPLYLPLYLTCERCAASSTRLSSSFSMHVLTTTRVSPQVCCVLDSPAFEMALPSTSGAELSTAVPALYLPLALGQLLEAQCDPHARVTSADAGAAAADTAPALSACSALLYEEGEVPVGRWDSSAPLIWLLATRCDAR